MYIFSCVCFVYVCFHPYAFYIHVSCFYTSRSFIYMGAVFCSLYSAATRATWSHAIAERTLYAGNHRRNGLGICQPPFSPLDPSDFSFRWRALSYLPIMVLLRAIPHPSRTVTQCGHDLQWWGQAAPTPTSSSTLRIRKRRGGGRGSMGMGKGNINTSSWRKFPKVLLPYTPGGRPRPNPPPPQDDLRRWSLEYAKPESSLKNALLGILFRFPKLHCPPL